MATDTPALPRSLQKFTPEERDSLGMVVRNLASRAKLDPSITSPRIRDFNDPDLREIGIELYRRLAPHLRGRPTHRIENASFPRDVWEYLSHRPAPVDARPLQRPRGRPQRPVEEVAKQAPAPAPPKFEAPAVAPLEPSIPLSSCAPPTPPAPRNPFADMVPTPKRVPTPRGQWRWVWVPDE